MQLTQITLSYTVSAGSSGNYESFRVEDEFFIRSDSAYLKREGGLDELAKMLIESSTRGGGVGRAIYDDVELTVHKPKSYRSYPAKRERGAQYYQSSVDVEAENIAHAVHLHEIKNRDIERNAESLALTRRDLERQINVNAALNRRHTSYEKIRNEQRKIERIEKRERLLMSKDKPMREISNSEAWRDLQKRKQQAQAKLEHMRNNKARYAVTLRALRDELRTVKHAQTEVQREQQRESKLLETRFNELKKTQQKAKFNYERGMSERSPLLHMSDADLRKQVEQQRWRELNPEKAAEQDQARWAEREKADKERARQLVQNRQRGRYQRDVE